MLQDGLGTIRSVVDNEVTVLESRFYDPYGVLLGTAGTNQTSYAFTGEPIDSNGLQYHRARYYAPNLGVFPSLDPFEGIMQNPMSLNGYSWVEGNVVNLTDQRGLSPSSIIDSLNALTCGTFFKPSTQETQPTSCEMPIEQGVAVLAYTAGREWNRTEHSATALMLMQMNAYRTPVQGATGFWTLIASDSQEQFVSTALRDYSYVADQRLINLANLMVIGYRSSCNPLQLFETEDPITQSLVRAAYPQVVANLSGLQYVASQFGDASSALKNEFSVHGDRADDIESFYPNVYAVAGGDRAVVITRANQTFPPLLYQCPDNASEVTL